MPLLEALLLALPKTIALLMAPPFERFAAAVAKSPSCPPRTRERTKKPVLVKKNRRTPR